MGMTAIVGLFSQFASLSGILRPEAPKDWGPFNFSFEHMWYVHESTFFYAQLTFVTSTLLIIETSSMCVTGRIHSFRNRVLLCYPVISLAFFTMITHGEFFTRCATEHLNHTVVNSLHLIYVFNCKEITVDVAGGLRDSLVGWAAFSIGYYIWVWVCFMITGTWPYPELDLRTVDGNQFFSVICVASSIVAVGMWAICRLMVGKVKKEKRKRK